MIKSEFLKIFKSKKCMFFTILFVLIPFIDLVQNIEEEYLDYWQHKEAYIGGLTSGMIQIAPEVSFLSGGSHGHLSQMLLIWLLPIHLLLIYCDSYIQEIRSGYSSIIFCKGSRKKIVLAKFSVSFLYPFLVCFGSLVLNYLLAHVAFWGGTGRVGIFEPEIMTAFEELCYLNPNITYMIYIVVFCFIAGCCGVFCCGLCFLFPGKKFVYPIAFFIWIKQINAEYSLTYAMQPFIEYGPEYFIPALLFFLCTVFVVFILAYLKKVKRDEIYKDHF